MSDQKPYDQETDDPQEDVPDSSTATDSPQEVVPDSSTGESPLPDPGTETHSPVVPTPDPPNTVKEDDVFGGEQDEAARLEVEKGLLTDSKNEPTAEDGEQPEEVKE